MLVLAADEHNYAGHLVFTKAVDKHKHVDHLVFYENYSRQFSQWKEMRRSFSFSVFMERLPVMQTERRCFRCIFMDALFHWFLEHFWKIFCLVYSQVLFKYISFVFNRFSPAIMCKIFRGKIKKSSKVRLHQKLFLSVCAYFMGASANNSLLWWKLDTKLCPNTFFRFC